jgi:hypothetical protein
MSEVQSLGSANRADDQFTKYFIGQRSAELDAKVSRSDSQSHEFHQRSIEDLFESYYEAGKTFGWIDEKQLMMTGAMCMSYAQSDNIPDFLKVDALELGASAFQEAAFKQSVDSHNDVHTVDSRIEVVNVADAMITLALTRFEVSPERGDRLMLRQLFTRALSDIVSGEITDETVAELRDGLKYVHQVTRNIPRPEGAAAAGLKGEIETLLYYWEQYTKKGQPVALPATVRGGSGTYNPEQTHDIDIIRQKNDGSWITLPPVEVKTRIDGQIAEEIKKRYTKSVLAAVTLGIGIVFSGDHRELNKEI